MSRFAWLVSMLALASRGLGAATGPVGQIPPIPAAAVARADRLSRAASPAVTAWVRRQAPAIARGSGDPHGMARAAAAQTSWAVLGNLGDADIEALAFLVMMEAAKSAQEDLKAVMAEVKAREDARERVREALVKVEEDLSRSAAKPRTTPCRPPECGLSAAALDQLGRAVPAGRRPVVARRPAATLADLPPLRDRLKGDLDSMNELGEIESLRLQMAMDRMSKMTSTLSNILKKVSETAESIVQNLK